MFHLNLKSFRSYLTLKIKTNKKKKQEVIYSMTLPPIIVADHRLTSSQSLSSYGREAEEEESART